MTFRFLASFHYHARTDLAQIAASAAGAPVQVFADSGAWSAYTKGVQPNLADYAAWLADWSGLITAAANLDVIGDPAATRANQAALEERGHAVLPVFHAGSPWAELEALCARYDYIALGGMVPYARHKRQDELMRWLVHAFKIGREAGVRFHGFGQTNRATLGALPFYSVDSSSWSGVRHGWVYLWDARAAKMRLVPLGEGKAALVSGSARRYADLIREHHADPAALADPLFARTAPDKPRAQVGAERAAAMGACALAWHRFGAWLADRHDVPPPPSLAARAAEAGRGTCLYLADSARDLPLAAAAIGAHG